MRSSIERSSIAIYHTEMRIRIYPRLYEENRPIIYRMREVGHSQSQIAHTLGFS